MKSLIFLYTIFICCFSEYKNNKQDYFNFKNINERFKRIVSFQSHQYEFNNKLFVDNLKNKRSINIFNDDKNNRKKRMVVSFFHKKWEFPISYFVDSNVDQRLVNEALQIIQKETCVRFVNQNKLIPGISGIRYYYGNGCNSPIGQFKKNQWQNISIGAKCDNLGIVLHETMHSLGFYHVHSRYDSRKYLYLLKENIPKENRFDFKKVNILNSRTFGIKFDFGSVMMYRINECSKNPRNTVLPFDRNFNKTMGNEEKITFNDIKLINMYYCRNKCSNKISCMNGGYQDPNDCSKCKCVEGFSGSRCHFLSPVSNECGKSILLSFEFISSFELNGKKKCIYHIFSGKDRKIGLFIYKSLFHPNKKTTCLQKNSLEIKYWKDKTATGARFCLLDQKILIISENNHVIIYVDSATSSNYVKILFKSIKKNFNVYSLKKEFLREISNRYN